MKYILCTIFLTGVLVAGLIWMDSRTQNSVAGAMSISLGDKTGHLRVNESTMFTLPDGGVLYVARLPRPLIVRTAGKVGK